MIEFKMRAYREVSSTNDIVKRAIEAGEAEGFAVRADVQTAGYGRQGRTWSSPEGGLYLSVLLRPNVEARLLPTVSLASAIAVRRALVGFVAPDAADTILLKWPNDVVVARCGQSGSRAADSAAPFCRADERRRFSSEIPGGYRKLAGISHELHAGALCVGIGANVARPAANAFEADGKNAAAYLRELPGAQSATCADAARAVLREYAAVYEAWLREGVEALLSEYHAHAYLTGRAVAVESRDGGIVREGVVRGVDEHGRLIVEDERGVRHAVASGEAHLR